VVAKEDNMTSWDKVSQYIGLGLIAFTPFVPVAAPIWLKGLMAVAMAITHAGGDGVPAVRQGLLRQPAKGYPPAAP
jgi:hypothetical protein